MGDIVIGSYAVPRKRAAVFALAFALWLLGLLLLHLDSLSGGAASLPLRFLPVIPLSAAWLLAGFPVLKNIAEKFSPVKVSMGTQRAAGRCPCRTACRDVGKSTLCNTAARALSNLLDENFLMAVASAGAFAIGEWEEAAGVMIFYMIGEIVQDTAVNRSRSSINALLALKPDKARVEDGGIWKEVPAAELSPGNVVLVRPGERIPLDGIIVEGESSVDASMLTGESRPVLRSAGDEVFSGTLSLNGVLRIKTTKYAGDSSAARIIQLVQSAQEAKAKPERFITAFARRYTPIVVAGAVLLSVLPPLLVPGARFADWFYRALILLVISCPCALVVSVPLGYFAGIGGMSRRGIMVKGAVHLDYLCKAKNVAFDKTGTLTRGEFSVAVVEAAPGVSEESLLETALLAERESNHPIARAIMEYAAARGAAFVQSVTAERFEIPGRGVEVVSGGERILAGNRRLLESRGIDAGGPIQADAADTAGTGAYTPVYLARGGRYLGRFLIGDTLKEGAAEAVEKIAGMGIRATMLTGDTRPAAGEMASRLGITSVRAELLPEDKLAEVEELSLSGITVFVGDGINDAPVLARSHVGIAMGSGADAAVEAADVIVMTGDPRRIPEAIERARKTRRIVIQNVIFALAAKGVFISLAAFGMANMWIALIADVGVALAAILNSTRALGNTVPAPRRS